MHILIIDYTFSVAFANKWGFTVGPFHLSVDYDNDIYCQLISSPSWFRQPLSGFSFEYKL